MRFINIKYAAVTLAAMGLSAAATAQQVFKVSQYTDHSFVHNPAAAGANGFTTVGGVFRSQWSGISGGPQTIFLFGDTYIDSKNTGVGVVLYSDKTGATSRSGGDIDFSYSVKLDDKGKKLMMGLGAQVLQFKVDKDKIAEFLPNDPLLASSGTTIKGDASAGVYYTSSTFNVGIAARQLIQPKLNFVESSTNEEGRLYRHYFLTANYRWRTDESNVLVPHAEIRFQPNAPADIEAGVMLEHKDLIRVGVSAHHKQDYTLFAGLKINHKFLISYAYDAYLKPVGFFEGGNVAHELMLRYFFSK